MTPTSVTLMATAGLFGASATITNAPCQGSLIPSGFVQFVTDSYARLTNTLVRVTNNGNSTTRTATVQVQGRDVIISQLGVLAAPPGAPDVTSMLTVNPQPSNLDLVARPTDPDRTGRATADAY